MQETVAKGITHWIREQFPDFKFVMEDYFDTEQGFTDELARKLAKVNYDVKTEAWTACMWNLQKPEPLSHRPKIFRVKDIQFVNSKGDLVPEDEALDPITRMPKKGYMACSPDYRFSIVQSVLQLDYIFNSYNNASLFQELFTLRIYMSQSAYISLPVIGKCCCYIDEVAMGDIDKFDRIAQGTLLSLPIDMVITYPLIAPVLPIKPLEPYTTERKPLTQRIIFNKQVVKPGTSAPAAKEEIIVPKRIQALRDKAAQEAQAADLTKEK